VSRWWRLPAIVAVAAVALVGCSQDSIPVNVPVFTETTVSTPAVPPPATPGRVSNSKDVLISSGGTQRRYRIHVPMVPGSGPRPLVVALHSGGSSPQGMEYSIGLDSVADRLSLFVIYPEAVSGHWNNGRPNSAKRSGGIDDAQFIVDVVGHAISRQPIDRKRVFVVGHGDGGIMAMNVAATHSEVFRGVGAVGGQMVDLLGQPRPKTPMPALFIHGNADPVFPWQGVATAKDGGPLLSVDATVKVYLALNGLGAAKPTVTAMPDRDAQDGTTVLRSVWGPSPTGFTVALYTVAGGGQPWPGGEVATRTQATRGRTSRDLDAANVVGHFAIEAGTPVAAAGSPSAGESSTTAESPAATP
jgi:polyhydroxybutyrate depolymerase